MFGGNRPKGDTHEKRERCQIDGDDSASDEKLMLKLREFKKI